MIPELKRRSPATSASAAATYAEGRRLRAGPARAAARRASSTTRRSRTTTRSSRRTRRTTARAVARRAAHLRHGRAPLPGRVPPAGRVREHDASLTEVAGEQLPLARQGHARGRLARRLRRGAARRAEGARAPRATRTRAPIRSCRRSRRARRSSAPRSRPTRARRSRRRATARPRCWRAMEGAGKLVEDDELREAMKDSGIGTPATRASIIERLIDVGYIVRDGRSPGADRQGHPGHRPARRARAARARA